MSQGLGWPYHCCEGLGVGKKCCEKKRPTTPLRPVIGHYMIGSQYSPKTSREVKNAVKAHLFSRVHEATKCLLHDRVLSYDINSLKRILIEGQDNRRQYLQAKTASETTYLGIVATTTEFVDGLTSNLYSVTPKLNHHPLHNPFQITLLQNPSSTPHNPSPPPLQP